MKLCDGSELTLGGYEYRDRYFVARPDGTNEVWFRYQHRRSRRRALKHLLEQAAARAATRERQ